MRYVCIATGVLHMLTSIFITSTTLAGVPFDGLTLFNQTIGNGLNHTTLINNEGNVVQQWTGLSPIASTPYLLQGGELLRPCRVQPPPPMTGAAYGGRVQRFSFDGTLLWDFTFSDENNQPHHDICAMPNGNVLLIAWERKTQQEGESAGRQNLNSEIWPAQIIEVQPTGPTSGEIIWEWHLWDHLIQDINPTLPNYGVISEHPEKLDINKGNIHPMNGDWIHLNALDYNPDLDQIVMSSNTLDEIFIINHATTTEEAAGPAGDFLYRWGNPANYERPGDHVLWNVHGVNWIDEGLPGESNLLLFNNGNDDEMSDLIEFTPPLSADGTYEIVDGQPFGPIPGDYAFFYESPDFHGDHLCGVYRLPNGNTVATNGPAGEIREIDASGMIVWQYFTPNSLMRAVKYPMDILNPPSTCSGDADGDGVVGVDDILLVISAWGPCADCDADVNEDGEVGVNDILTVIGNWGPCP
jgi:hypothetical protein